MLIVVNHLRSLGLLQTEIRLVSFVGDEGIYLSPQKLMNLWNQGSVKTVVNPGSHPCPPCQWR